MIIACIAWLLRKYLANKKTATLSIAFFLMVPLVTSAETLKYNVIYHGKNVGNMYFTKSFQGDDLHVKIVSNVSMRFLMAVKVNISEESVFKKDVLTWSNVYQEINGKVKVNRQTKLNGPAYQTIAEGKQSVLNSGSIRFNIGKLYHQEPLMISQVYSDNYQQFLSVKNIGPHSYRVQLPDNHYNIYHYENGICKTVEVHSTLYTIQMQLDSNNKG